RTVGENRRAAMLIRSLAVFGLAGADGPNRRASTRTIYAIVDDAMVQRDRCRDARCTRASGAQPLSTGDSADYSVFWLLCEDVCSSAHVAAIPFNFQRVTTP
ncbi:MAG: hypothetical protein AAF645_30445, partial [Myxococcota bacterium]